jgi:hypothetical protein
MLLTAVNPSCRRSAVHVQPHETARPAPGLKFFVRPDAIPLLPQCLADVPPPPSICWPITAMAR